MARTGLIWAPTGLVTPTIKLMLDSAPLVLVETGTLAEHGTIKRAYTWTIDVGTGEGHYRYNLLTAGAFIGGGSIYIGDTDDTTYEEDNLGYLPGTTLGALSPAERTAIANEVEAQIINEADAEQVLTAITNKIATAFADLDDLSLSAIATAVWQRVLIEGYRATGAEGTAEQLMYEILQNLTEFDITNLIKTVKKLDGTTTAKTYGLNDADNPTSITEAT